MTDRDEIMSLIGSLAVGVDGRRWDDVLDLFASQVEVDYSSLFGGEPQYITREQLIANWRQLVPGFTHTTHLIGLPAIIVNGASAEASASVVAWHMLKDEAVAGKDLWLVGGTYEFAFSKEEARWRIAGLTLARAWSDGNQDLPRLAALRASHATTMPG